VRGSTTPRLWTKPLVTGPPGLCGCGCALTPGTSLGFSAVEFARDVIGFDPLPWQRWLLIHALELRPDGRFRFRTVLILIARQNGKTSLVEIKNLWKMFVQGAQVLGTAQDLDVSEESWDNAVEICEGNPELAVEIKDVIKVNGKKALKLSNGARWKVKAANRRGGRGFTGDDVNLDELREHKNWKAWGAVTKTTMARRNAQVWAYTNAGDDESIVLNDVQASARATVTDPSVDPQMGLFEWSVPDDVKCTCGRVRPTPHGSSCRLADRRLWAMANPSLGYQLSEDAELSEDALMSALNTDPNEIFLTECLCQRVPNLVAGDIDAAAWQHMLDPESQRQGDVTIGVDLNPQQTAASIGLFGMRDDGREHLQLMDCRPGIDWVVGRLIELRTILNPVGYAMGRNTHAALEAALKKADFLRPEKADEPERGNVAVVAGSDMSAACGQLLTVCRPVRGDNGEMDYRARHIGQKELDDAALAARIREGTDSVGWSRKDSDGDITAINSVTVAKWLYQSWAHLVANDYDLLDSVI
jgi:hypothetical protein